MVIDTLLVICIEMSPTRVTQYAIPGYPISHYGTPSRIYRRAGPPDLAQVYNHALVGRRCLSNHTLVGGRCLQMAPSSTLEAEYLRSAAPSFSQSLVNALFPFLSKNGRQLPSPCPSLSTPPWSPPNRSLSRVTSGAGTFRKSHGAIRLYYCSSTAQGSALKRDATLTPLGLGSSVPARRAARARAGTVV